MVQESKWRHLMFPVPSIEESFWLLILLLFLLGCVHFMEWVLLFQVLGLFSNTFDSWLTHHDSDFVSQRVGLVTAFHLTHMFVKGWNHGFPYVIITNAPRYTVFAGFDGFFFLEKCQSCATGFCKDFCSGCSWSARISIHTAMTRG